MAGPSSTLMNMFRDLQVTLGYSHDTIAHYNSFGHSQISVDAFLMRFLKSEGSPRGAASKLAARRTFERSLPAFTVTAGMVAALRGEAFSILGRDVDRRVVLYFNLRHLSMPALEMDEVQRLTILLLEYMQFLSVKEGSTTASSGTYRQEFVLVINEEEVEWHTQQGLLSKAGTLHSLFTKYYPGLVALVLVVGAGLETREGIKASVQTFPAELKEAVQFIQRSSLTQYLDRAVIPVELGGSLRTTGNGMNFSEMVLRHWYTLTTFLLEEAAHSGERGTAARPLYILPPQRNVTPPRVGPSKPLFSPKSRAGSFAHYPDEDDGLCSMLSQPDETDERTELFLQEDADLNSTVAQDPRQLLKAYRMECAMRKAAEQRLQLASAPLQLDPNHTSAVEKALTGIHRDVNTMLLDVLSRAKAAASADQPPTLEQLLALTIAALEEACGQPSPPPALQAAPPAQEEELKDSCCCC